METLSKIIKEHMSYKNQIFKMAKSDLIKTYRGAALGWAWAIIKPAVTIFVYWFAFEIGLRAGSSVNGYPFFLWLVASVIPWFYMSEMITGGTDCIRRYSYLVTKMKFPVSTIPTFTNISKFIIHCMLIYLVIILFRIFGYVPDIYLLQLPFYMLLTFIFFNIWGLLSAPLAVISKDYSNLVKSFITAVFWLSGIMWDPATVKNAVLKKVLKVNPVTYLVTGFRNCFINKVWFWESPKTLICFILVTVVMGIAALWVYKKTRKEIPDVL